MSVFTCIKNFVTGERVFYWLTYNLILAGGFFVLIGWNVIVMGRGVAWSSPTLEESDYSAPARKR
jgi:hypothetical protein